LEEANGGFQVETMGPRAKYADEPEYLRKDAKTPRRKGKTELNRQLCGEGRFQFEI
jgi:hypothetical protein